MILGLIRVRAVPGPCRIPVLDMRGTGKQLVRTRRVGVAYKGSIQELI